MRCLLMGLFIIHLNMLVKTLSFGSQKMALNAENYNTAKIHVEQQLLGMMVFYKFLNFALYFIVLHWGKTCLQSWTNWILPVTPPRPKILSAPHRINQLLKVKLSCITVLFACLLIHLFIYFGSTNVQKLCMMF